VEQQDREQRSLLDATDRDGGIPVTYFLDREA
jgi:hypothetical protein